MESLRWLAGGNLATGWEECVGFYSSALRALNPGIIIPPFALEVGISHFRILHMLNCPHIHYK